MSTLWSRKIHVYESSERNSLYTLNAQSRKKALAAKSNRKSQKCHSVDRTSVCVYVYVFVFVYVFVCVYIYIYIRVYVYVYVHLYVHVWSFAVYIIYRSECERFISLV